MKISVLGSTGSVGTQTLEVVEFNSHIEVFSLIANTNWQKVYEQCQKYRPQMVGMFDEKAAKELKTKLKGTNIKVLAGIEGIIECCCHEEVDTVLSAIVGKAGLLPTYHAILNKKNIALANKETLVIAGHIITEVVKENNVKLIPVDSEHSAIFQCLQGQNSEIEKIILTASGGPFRGKKIHQLENVTIGETLNHPNWSMGKKISIDSATLINKGLEAIEAKWLFDVSLEKIQITIHPQSIIHSAVQFIDGNIIAHLSPPDMRYAVEYALNYPNRRPSKLPRLNLFNQNLTFEEPDFDTFKGLGLSLECGKRGGSAPIILNASNEVCVESFLEGKISFLQIPEIIEKTISLHRFVEKPNLQEILDIDQWAREKTKELIY
ncbi:1-deoxy-D-xylulose 5-phosphate reductoisomerase [Anaerobranca californiensis DSM 14826]|jgi:1-deoxy-D-xylulose-5-phosphate reductoisomerase|uniref:1-deoxy-D-xylulose 5-phosphate reductoisomerase n=1 Tax=Anaerobranca californiensis DSM 14826 TaxID=1120989 RepID=A0A1M6KFF3_9FIRM|nr:1-deoxy-D-xylulose-5-phosphate reductoisomerase [Anaerobranca californiensis]SHJ57711.1 1-deoxy-D-xylulose 5-phosphate reductoisomerase [Anaerobranca californiensis DSM 14826]